jgi:Mak10 subunit, NatC N(alpha)-terminal acetyltransferase
MDSGYLEPGEKLEDEYDVFRNLLPGEVIGIMDQILCHEVSVLDDELIKDKYSYHCRLHGTWVIHSHKPFLRVCTSKDFYGQSPKHSTRPNSPAV